VMTVLIGLLAPLFNIEGALEGAATSYILGLYPNAVLPSVPAGFSFDLESAGIAFAFVLAGAGAAYVIYVARRVEPSRFVGQTGIMHGIHGFLVNRWYLNAIYYKVFVDPVISSSRWVLNSFELNGLERVNSATAMLWMRISRAGNWIDGSVVDAMVRDVAIDGESISRALRRVQNCVLQRYALIFSAGLAMILILFILATGVLG
jgi:NADH:ubiquinone oxidoreductase subunit 5 (subunit L)/multisubunit Na+/H+ antiporter MnhA subunit